MTVITVCVILQSDLLIENTVSGGDAKTTQSNVSFKKRIKNCEINLQKAQNSLVFPNVSHVFLGEPPYFWNEAKIKWLYLRLRTAHVLDF